MAFDTAGVQEWVNTYIHLILHLTTLYPFIISFIYVVHITVIDCGAPKLLSNGDFEFISGENNEYLSVLEYHCNEPYYRFKDTSKGQIPYKTHFYSLWLMNHDLISLLSFFHLCSNIQMCSGPKMDRSQQQWCYSFLLSW